MLVASLFRHESGRLVAALTRLFGPRNLALAEDVVQEALECALEAWKFALGSCDCLPALSCPVAIGDRLGRDPGALQSSL
jgi:hypothetical protein